MSVKIVPPIATVTHSSRMAPKLRTIGYPRGVWEARIEPISTALTAG
jgi:hypothetical protein